MSTETAYFFGTFNPIHNGHLIMAQTVLNHGPYQRVLFIPAFAPPHREKSKLAKFIDRYTMVKLACLDNRRFHVSDIESKLLVPSYTIETLRALIPDFDQSTKPIPMIMGQDAIAHLGSWYQAETLIEKVCFLQAPRSSGEHVESVQVNNKTIQLNTKIIEMPSVDISSTLIRNNIAEQKSIRYLTPEPVHRYMHWNWLYLT